MVSDRAWQLRTVVWLSNVVVPKAANVFQPEHSPPSPLSMKAGFPKQRRLLNAKDFGPVFNKADVKVSGRTLLVLARHNTLGQSRLGLVVSKKNARLAVQRNRIKRLVRESFRTEAGLPELDIVFLARRGLTEQDNTEIEAELTRVWTKLKKKGSVKQ